MLSAVFAENVRWSLRSFSLQLVPQWTTSGQQNIPSLALECPCIFTLVPQECDPQTEALPFLPQSRHRDSCERGSLRNSAHGSTLSIHFALAVGPFPCCFYNLNLFPATERLTAIPL